MKSNRVSFIISPFVISTQALGTTWSEIQVLKSWSFICFLILRTYYNQAQKNQQIKEQKNTETT